MVRNRGVVLSQPQDIPLLVFADRKTGPRRRRPAAGRNFACCASISSTGQTVYRNDRLPDTSITRFRIRGERARVMRLRRWQWR